MATILFLVVGGYLLSVDHVNVTRTTAVYRPKTRTLGGVTIAAPLLGAGLSTLFEDTSYLSVLPFVAGLAIPIIAAFILREPLREEEKDGFSLR